MSNAKMASAVKGAKVKASAAQANAIQAIVDRLGKAKLPGLRALREKLAAAAFQEVEEGARPIRYQHALATAVKEGRSGARNGVIYAREILSLSDAQAKKEADLILASAEEEYGRAHAAEPKAEEALAPAPTPTKGGSRIRGADVFAKA